MNETHLINIDLDLESTTDLSPIIEEWGDDISLHQHQLIDGIYCATFETFSSEVTDIINDFVSLIEGLSETSRVVWDKARKRDFDFGYQSGGKPNGFRSTIDAELVQKLANVGGSVVVTIYPE